MQARDEDLRGAALLRRLLAVPREERDGWCDVRLGLPEAPPDVEGLPRGAVPYLPAGADEILTLMQQVPLGPEDVLVDVGSGLGRVLLLTHLVTDARGHGIEVQAPLVALAEKCRDALGIPKDVVSFSCENAAQAELNGTAFFLYSPFNGETLTTVFSRLVQLAERQRISICAVGFELPPSPALRRRESGNVAVALYESSNYRFRTG